MQLSSQFFDYADTVYDSTFEFNKIRLQIPDQSS